MYTDYGTKLLYLSEIYYNLRWEQIKQNEHYEDKEHESESIVPDVSFKADDYVIKHK